MNQIPAQTSTSNLKVTKLLEKVPEKYYKLYTVDKTCPVSEFVKGISESSCTGLGYGFYEFKLKPELISYDKQVILMDKVFTKDSEQY